MEWNLKRIYRRLSLIHLGFAFRDFYKSGKILNTTKDLVPLLYPCVLGAGCIHHELYERWMECIKLNVECS